MEGCFWLVRLNCTAGNLHFYKSTLLQIYTSTLLQFYNSTNLQIYKSTNLQIYNFKRCWKKIIGGDFDTPIIPIALYESSYAAINKQISTDMERAF
jgi:hypothetical protein